MPAGLLSDLRIFQVAVVVRDLDAYVTRHSALLGNGPWRVYEFGPHIVQRYMMYGEPASARPLFALNDGRPQVEIIQPVCEPSIYQDWLDRRGEGLHHVAALVDSVTAVVDAAAEQGIGVLSSGEAFGVGGSGRFAYLDSERVLGTIREVVEPPNGLGEPLRRL